MSRRRTREAGRVHANLLQFLVSVTDATMARVHRQTRLNNGSLMQINYVRRGHGSPLLLIHGLGSSWHTWRTVLDTLARERSVIAIDLPGFGKSPALLAAPSIDSLADAVTLFLREHDLIGTDAVGSSMGARLVLELARRGGVVGTVVSLDPGAFWSGWQRYRFHASVWTFVRLLRMMQSSLPAITANERSRAALMWALSAQPGRLSAAQVLEEMQGYVSAASFDDLLAQLAHGKPQRGAPRGTIGDKRMVIGWGRDDRLCHPRQARRALQLFPDATMHWFERCGHYPHWDAPEETARLILETTEQ